MLDFDYEEWWSLHLRVAKGESLSQPEQRTYQVGLEQIDSQSKNIEGDTILYLRTLRAAIGLATSQQAELTDRTKELDAQIIALESQYQRLTGQTLNWDPHVSA